MIRVGLLLPFASDGWRSIDRFVDALVENVPKIDADIELVLSRPPEKWKKWGDVMARRGLYSLFSAREKFDVYHIVDQSYSNTARFLPSARTLITCHDLEFWRRRSPLNAPVRAWIARSMLNTGNIVVPSGVIAREVVALGRALNRVAPEPVVAPNGCGPEFHEPLNREENILRWNPERRPLLLNVANSHWPRKNVAFLGEVLAQLRKKIPDILFVQVGPEWDTELVRHFAGGSLERNVIRHGGLDTTELVALYGAADLYLHSSLYEGFGFPVLEAVACGTPYLAGDIPVTAELFQHSGGLLPFRVEYWVERIQHLLRGPEERKKLLKGQRRDLQSYSLRRQAEDYAGIYRKLGR